MGAVIGFIQSLLPAEVTIMVQRARCGRRGRVIFWSRGRRACLPFIAYLPELGDGDGADTAINRQRARRPKGGLNAQRGRTIAPRMHSSHQTRPQLGKCLHSVYDFL